MRLVHPAIDSYELVSSKPESWVGVLDDGSRFSFHLIDGRATLLITRSPMSHVVSLGNNANSFDGWKHRQQIFDRAWRQMTPSGLRGDY